MRGRRFVWGKKIPIWSRKTCFSGTKGQALIETALILPLLLFIFIGIFEFGRAWYIKNTLNNAARIGARTAIVQANLVDQSYVLPASCEGITDPIKLAICNGLNGLPKNEISVSIDVVEKDPPQKAISGDTVVVKVRWDNYNPLTFSYIGLNLKITNSLTGMASMRYE